MIRLVGSIVAVIALLSAGLAATSFRTRRSRRKNANSRPGHDRGRARLCDGASRHLEPGLVPDRRARPELAVARKIIDFSRFRGRAGHQTSLGQPGAELQDRAGSERDDATGTGRVQREATWSGSNSATFRVWERSCAKSRSRRDQYRRCAFWTDESRKAVRRGSDQGRRRRDPSGAGPCAGCKVKLGPIRTSHILPQPVQRDGWRGRHAPARRSKDRRSHRGRDDQDQRGSRNHLGHRMTKQTGAHELTATR